MKRPHTIFTRHLIATRRSLLAAALTTGFAVYLGTTPANADTEWEYEAGEGYHEEEWYDPSDWFNEDEQISYESDWWDTGTYRGTGYTGATGATDRDYTTYDAGTDTTTNYAATSFYYWDPVDVTWTQADENQQTTAGTGDRQQAQQQQRDRQQAQQQQQRDRQQAQQQQRNRQQAQQQGRDRQQTADRALPGERTYFNGTIDGFQRVDLKTPEGVSEEHSFVRLRLRDGQSRVVSLGTNVDVNQLDLSQGDHVQVAGEVANLDDRRILLADRIRAGDQTFQVKDQNQIDRSQLRGDQTAQRRQQQDRQQQQTARRERQQQQQTAQRERQREQQQTAQQERQRQQQTAQRQDQQRQQGRQVTVQGKLQDHREVDLGGREDNLVVRLEMHDGSDRVVDLGPGASLDDLGLDRGDQIQVEGTRRNIGDREVVVARSIRVTDREQLRGQEGQQQSASGGMNRRDSQN